MLLGVLPLLLLGPIGVLAFGKLDLAGPSSSYMTDRESTNQAPDPAAERGAGVQAMAPCGLHVWAAAVTRIV